MNWTRVSKIVQRWKEALWMILTRKASLDGSRAIVDDYRLVDQHVL
jgi:hypothetical protein